MQRCARQPKQKKQNDVFFLTTQHAPSDRRRRFPALCLSHVVMFSNGKAIFASEVLFFFARRIKSKCQPRDKESAETIWWSECGQYALPWEQTLPWLKEQCVTTITPSSLRLLTIVECCWGKCLQHASPHCVYCTTPCHKRSDRADLSC